MIRVTYHMYAQTYNPEHVPLGWEQVEHLWRVCTMYGIRVQGYQLVWERKTFSDPTLPEIRCCLRRWVNTGDRTEPTRVEVLLTTHEPEPMAAALLMLSKELEAERGGGFSTKRS